MRKQITYFDPRVIENDPNRQKITITAATEDEFDATMAAITNPTREIPQDSIVISDLPPAIDPIEQLRADLDYIALMNGVDLSV